MSALRDRPVDATRERLLSAVGELMTERRSTEVSLSEIALKSGVNSSLVKYYFGNKAGLMIELLRRALGPRVAQMRHLAAIDLPAHEKLRIHIGGIVQTYAAYPYINRLMHTLLVESPGHGPLITEEFSRPIADLQASILAQGVAAGVFRPVPPAFLYLQIVGPCDHLFFGRAQLADLFGIAAIDDRTRRDFAAHLHAATMAGLAPVE